MEPTDALLMQRWRAGDTAAAATVVDRYAGALGAAAYAVLGDAALAQDAVQETFMRASARLPDSNGVDRLGPWLLGIVRHVALDVVRKRRREVPMADHDGPAGGTTDGDAAKAELRECLQRALEALPADQREVFAMKYVSGLRYAEIARATGTTPEAVSQKLWRIRQKLQHELKEFRP